MRTQLAATLQGVVCQTLVKQRDRASGRAVATEVLITTPAIANLIREGKTYQIALGASGRRGSRHAHHGPAPRRARQQRRRSRTRRRSRRCTTPRTSSGSCTARATRIRQALRFDSDFGDAADVALMTYAYRGRDAAGKVVKGKLEAASEAAVVARLRTMGSRRSTIAGVGSGNRPADASISLGGSRQGRRAQGPRDHEPPVGDDGRRRASRCCATLDDPRRADREQEARAHRSPQVRDARRDRARRSPTRSREHPDVFPPLMINLVRAGEVGRLPRRVPRVDRGRPSRPTSSSAADDQVGDDLPGRRARHGHRRGDRHAALHRADLREDVRRPRRRAAAAHADPRRAVQEHGLGACRCSSSGSSVFAVWWRKNKHDEQRAQSRRPAEAQAAGLRRAVPEGRARALRAQLRDDDRAPACRSCRRSTSSARPRATGSSSRRCTRSQDSVRAGQLDRGTALREEPVFPPMVVQMIAVGEDSGSLEQMLGKIAEFYDEEVQSTTEQLTALIEPLMIAVHRRRDRRHDRRPVHADLHDLRPDQRLSPRTGGRPIGRHTPICGITPQRRLATRILHWGVILLGGRLSIFNIE